MVKTTVYLPDELKDALGRVAQQTGRSEADLVREAISALTRATAAPKPRLPLFASGDPTLAERVEDALEGFGES